MQDIDTGLCGRCVHAIVRPTRRGTTYLRCALAQQDDRFPKYPRLPMLACPGFADRREPGGASGR